MRPVERNAVAQLAAEQRVDRHAERLCLGIEQRILDRADRLRHDAAGGWARRGVKLRIDALVIADALADDLGGKARDCRTDSRRAEVFGKLAPADDAVVGGQLDEMIVAPAGVAGERLDGADFHGAPRRAAAVRRPALR